MHISHSTVAYTTTDYCMNNMESTSSSSSASGSVENLAGKSEIENGQTSKAAQFNEGSDQPGPSCSTAGAEGGQHPIDPLFQRQRKDIVFELRRLKLGDRPVTGQGNREAVEQLFNRRYNQDENEEPEQHHRPEQVIVEVQGLVESRPVTSLLQTLQFRQRLEGALRSSIATLTVRNNRIARASEASRRASSQTSATDGSPARTSPAHARTPPTAPGGPAATSAPVVPVNNEPSAPEERAASWLQEHVPVPPPINENVQVAFSFDDMQQMQREDVIGEISELVQQQLVTHTLEGSFRETLENRILRERLASSGENGRRVQEFIQMLPRGRVMRNGFSNLHLPGAIPLAADALSDTVSVISATAAVQVSSQNNTLMVREIASLKAQMREMQNMMRLSFDLQLDVQRAIRQEVSAALAQVAGGTATATPARHCPVNDSKCVICIDKLADTVMYQCGHLCTCYTCGMTLKTRGHHCPMCRAPIKDIIRAYKASLE